MYDEGLQLAKEAAARAGEFLSRRRNIRVDGDFGHDIKLNSDKESERIIIDCLKVSNLPILSEECGLVGDSGGLCWIVDPLDGTMNYFKGLDELCCVSIALFDGGEPVLGVVNRFAAGEMFCGAPGAGAAFNGAPVRTSGVESLKDAVMATGFPSAMDYSESSLAGFTRRVQGVKKVRMLGSAALMAAFVACGKVDFYFERDIRLWDVAGAMAIVKAAGGAVKLQMKDADYKCDFGAFAGPRLMEAFYAS